MSNLNDRRVANGWIRPRAFPSSLSSRLFLVHSSPAVTSRVESPAPQKCRFPEIGRGFPADVAVALVGIPSRKRDARLDGGIPKYDGDDDGRERPSKAGEKPSDVFGVATRRC